MRLHDRYLFRELLTPLAYCLGAFLIFWLSLFFFTKLDDIRDAGLTLMDSVELAVAGLPSDAVLMMPVALLLALLYALSQHAKSNEITALRAAGLGLWRLSAPYFAVGLIACGIYFALNEIAVPRCIAWTEEILTRHPAGEKVNKTSAMAATPAPANRPAIVRGPKTATRFTKAGFHNVRSQRTWQMSEFDYPTATVLNPIVIWTLQDGSKRELDAAKAVHVDGVWTFYGAKLFSQTGSKGFVPTLATNVLAMREFEETPRQMLLAVRFSNTQGLLGSRSADIPLADIWEYMQQLPNLSPLEMNKLSTKLHGRLAATWVCLVVVLLAIPFGAPSGRRNLFYGVAGGIFIVFGFFIVQQVSLALGMSGAMPGWLAGWLPNIVFGLTGIVLTSRVR